MRILILSDIHGNFEALSSVDEKYDELWVLGDLVNYGPDPGAVVDFVRSTATLVVCGNHDFSIGYNQEPRCSPPFREMADATRRYSDSVLTFGQKHYLRHLPPYAEVKRQGINFYLCHAVPSNPLYGYCEADSPQWANEAEGTGADVILVGHTHVPALRMIGHRVVANPGSLGQPKTGGPEARYAIWENGKVELKTLSYPFETTAAKVSNLPIDVRLRDELKSILRTGELPRA